MLVSQAPGRLRLRLPAWRGDVQRFRTLAEEALMLPGVTSAAGNPATAGLLLRHRGTTAAVLSAATRQGLFRLGPPATSPPPDPAALADAAGGLFAALAVAQVFRGALLPPAVTLAWYAGVLLRRR